MYSSEVTLTSPVSNLILIYLFTGVYALTFQSDIVISPVVNSKGIFNVSAANTSNSYSGSPVVNSIGKILILFFLLQN